MKKVNKILMATVSVLLSLVLITTSVVSGVFAKFSLKKIAVADDIKLTKFGASVTVNQSSLQSFVTTRGGSYNADNVDKDDIIASATGFTMGPGDECLSAVKFTVGNGAPSVPAALKIKIELNYQTDYFKIVDTDNTEFKGITAGATKYFLPIGFSFKADSSSPEYIEGPWIVGSSASEISPATVSNLIATAIKNRITSPTGATVKDNVVTVPLTQGVAPNLKFKIGTNTYTTNDFYVGFGWPLENSDTTYNYDIITTCLAENFPTGTDDFFSYKVTVWIEQTAARPTT